MSATCASRKTTLKARGVGKSFRLHVGIFGRRNVGKSSLLNALTRQQVSIVSEVAGTTTDPVEKPMEMLPLGPVLLIDTAGVDDEGALGQMRVGRTRRIFDRTDLGIVVAEAGQWGRFEEEMLAELKRRGVPAVVVFNKSDLGQPEPELERRLAGEGLKTARTVSSKGEGVMAVREALIESVPKDFITPPAIIADLVPRGGVAVLVVPVDKEAPKGRLINPQVQTIRDLLDNGSYCVVTREHELAEALARLNRPPAIVVTDSQAFEKVVPLVPAGVMVTGFSILFARLKGDLAEMVRGACAIDRLRPGDRVLVAEACSHHPIEDDIGREKIPRWLTTRIGGALEFETTQGQDFPDDLSRYRLVVHCGSCMWNRRMVLSRIMRCVEQSVPITNYGLTIAYCLGMLERALEPFPAALDAYRSGARR
ncbi:[FeFe] hydrogenase H-cluster maturation GTPase HydF [candidate division WOR-3 bacterium]|nr:[FeFe] hydrogenase H-cluster maturation GTPase HydF [candidate division WOR-3 bacterium]